jgi:hypothetical protein
MPAGDCRQFQSISTKSWCALRVRRQIRKRPVPTFTNLTIRTRSYCHLHLLLVRKMDDGPGVVTSVELIPRLHIRGLCCKSSVNLSQHLDAVSHLCLHRLVTLLAESPWLRARPRTLATNTNGRSILTHRHGAHDLQPAPFLAPAPDLTHISFARAISQGKAGCHRSRRRRESSRHNDVSLHHEMRRPPPSTPPWGSPAVETRPHEARCRQRPKSPFHPVAALRWQTAAPDARCACYRRVARRRILPEPIVAPNDPFHSNSAPTLQISWPPKDVINAQVLILPIPRQLRVICAAATDLATAHRDRSTAWLAALWRPVLPRPEVREPPPTSEGCSAGSPARRNSVWGTRRGSKPPAPQVEEKSTW